MYMYNAQKIYWANIYQIWYVASVGEGDQKL